MSNTEFPIPQSTLNKWQEIVDIVARVAGVRAALIMRLRDKEIEVGVSSRTAGNPYRPGSKELLFGSGLYCERVITTGAPLFVGNSAESSEWRGNPDEVDHSLIAYLGFPIRLSDGRPFGTLCLLDDRTMEKSDDITALMEKMSELIEKHLQARENLWLEQQLAKQHENIAHLARGLVHDFNNVIGTLGGNIEFLREKGSETGLCEEEKGALDDMESALDRAKALVEALHSVGWDEEVTLAPIHADELCRELSRSLPRIMPSSIEVRVGDCDDTEFLSHKPLLMAAILNFALNARDAMPDGGILEVSARRMTWNGQPSLLAGTWVAGEPGLELRISDSGSGIALEDVPRLLEPMFTTKKEQGGHGLGLTMAGNFIARAQAALWVESTPGQGASFHILMPLAGK
jgi:signal transduction histidine kinase